MISMLVFACGCVVGGMGERCAGVLMGVSGGGMVAGLCGETWAVGVGGVGEADVASAVDEGACCRD